MRVRGPTEHLLYLSARTLPTGQAIEALLMEQLPPEILYDVAAHAHSAGDILALSQASRRVHDLVAADGYRCLQALIRARVPGVAARVPPIWRDAVRALTAREQALEARAIHARLLVVPPSILRAGSNRKGRRRDRPTIGFRPPVDSYEHWCGTQSWNDRKEVFAYGAGADLIVRVKHIGRHQDWVEEGIAAAAEGGPRGLSTGDTAWSIYGASEQAHSLDDITGVHLIAQRGSVDAGEEVIYARRRGDLQRVVVEPAAPDAPKVRQRFVTDADSYVYGTDVDETGSTLAATEEKGAIRLYHLDDQSPTVVPFACVERDGRERSGFSSGASRTLTSRLLDSGRLVVWSLHGDQAISVVDVTAPDLCETLRLVPPSFERKHVHAMNAMHGDESSQLLLTGWQDGSTRLHDLRDPRWSVGTFEDAFRDEPVYCLQSISPAYFLTGLGAEGVVQLYDVRQPGRVVSERQALATPAPTSENGTGPLGHSAQGDGFTMFVPPKVHGRPYRGPIYSMSQPSPSSSTVWVGIEDGVVRLDLVTSHDLAGPSAEWLSTSNQLETGRGAHTARRAPQSDFRHFSLNAYQTIRGESAQAASYRRTAGPASTVLTNPPFLSQLPFAAGVTQARLRRRAARRGERGGLRERRDPRWVSGTPDEPLPIDFVTGR
ncbi:hypothetical protein KEM52_003464 [Ascosphaera acerosa]|nr:hypothetical protein KEM52_003464 [Ascosphaera acerosa]